MMFEWAAPAEVLTALKTYCSDLYGSILWNLGGEKASLVFSAGDTAVKLAWSCPRWTKTFLLQQVLACDMTSARTDVLGRYAKFSMGLRTSVCQEVRVLFNYISRDLQSITAKNIKLVRDTSGLDPWVAASRQLKKAIHGVLEGEVLDVPAQPAAGGQALCAGQQGEIPSRPD